MGLDDAVPIGKVLPFLDVQIALGSGLLLGSVFHGKQSLLVAKMYLYYCSVFWISGEAGMGGWDEIDLDDVPKWALGMVIFFSNPHFLTCGST